MTAATPGPALAADAATAAYGTGPRGPRRSRLLRYAALAVVPAYLALVTTGIALQAAYDQVEDEQLGISGTVLFGVAFLGSAALGSLIALRRPENSIGWLFCAGALLFAVEEAAYGYAGAALAARDGSWPAGAIAALVGKPAFLSCLVVITQVLLRFPTGEPPTRHWRLVSTASLAAFACATCRVVLFPGAVEGFPSAQNPLALPPAFERPLLVSGLFGLPVLFGSLVAAVVSLVARARRAPPHERRQVWHLLGAGTVFVGGLSMLFFGPSTTTDRVGEVLLLLGWAGVLHATAVAVLRYQVYGSDVFISRALVFALLTAFVTLGYVAIVVGLGSAFGAAGEPSLALSLAATAAIAVGFGPMRRWVQQVVDRVVYGRRATPYEALAHFSQTMSTSYAADELLHAMTDVAVAGTSATRAEVWVVSDGRPVRVAGDPAAPTVAAGTADLDPDAAGYSIPIRHRGEVLGALVVHPPLGHALNRIEQELLSDLAGQAGMLLRNVALIEDLKASSRRLVTAADEERRGIERDLHAGVQRRIESAAAALTSATEAMSAYEGSPARALLGQAAEELATAREELRDLARGIHPAALTDEGLVPAIAALASRSPVPVSVTTAEVEGLEPAVEATAYFVVSEALTNVVKHAQASSVSVTIERTVGQLRVEVTDDGVGGADPGGGSGLVGLRDRVAALGGELAVRSSSADGTCVVAVIPCG